MQSDILDQQQQQSHTLRASPSSTNIYSRYRLPSTASTDTTASSNQDVVIDHKRSYTIDNLNTLAYFSSSDNISAELTPSAAIRDRYYQSSRYLQDNHHADELEDDSFLGEDEEGEVEEEEDTVYEEAIGDVFDYRPGDSNFYTKPKNTPSIYSINDSVISLRTEYNGEDNRSINSIRTVDDRMQGRSTSLLGANLNSLAKTAKKVSRSSSIFRTNNNNNNNTEKNTKKKLEPFVPVRDHYLKDNSSIRSVGGTSLLSKLSKSTAPMRAKLSAISHLASRHHARIEHTPSIALPGRKRVAESVYNIPMSSSSSISINNQPRPSINVNPSTSTKKKSTFEKAQSFTFNLPRTLSASSSTNSNASSNKLIVGSTLVDEPGSIAPIKANERMPAIYPALLSKVAEAFQERIVLSTRAKDSIKYKDVFDGKEAVVSLNMGFYLNIV